MKIESVLIVFGLISLTIVGLSGFLYTSSMIVTSFQAAMIFGVDYGSDKVFSMLAITAKIHLVIILILLPGLISTSVGIFEFNHNPKWHSVCLKIISFILFFGFPLLSVLAVYLFIISGRRRFA
ncbi:hypothetical protein L1F30_15655 [Simiduia sp. 21SJ11W-1]|uniref:hypothetical protein n=1 Tax=Simiduia sp. 21SJ11W-1 TaxID=2909669 RepID=UPI00209CEB42|nr:hypothetical protein [Simiduia sp. 21SJ11W-1]UTA47577.1 hypothetical protein L1F30_15655 [Simiduia sp. 21SJ11W-1]